MHAPAATGLPGGVAAHNTASIRRPLKPSTSLMETSTLLISCPSSSSRVQHATARPFICNHLHCSSQPGPSRPSLCRALHHHHTTTLPACTLAQLVSSRAA
mmetsp:Transcript_8692/g.21537  ORF Transcript_8692/g.21537 Transcript_8692/m.21537 type:complete len:101 (+) Transcript_8692:218-520(+)